MRCPQWPAGTARKARSPVAVTPAVVGVADVHVAAIIRIPRKAGRPIGQGADPEAEADSAPSPPAPSPPCAPESPTRSTTPPGGAGQASARAPTPAAASPTPASPTPASPT